MDIQSEKIELAKRLLDTEDRGVIDAVKSIFKNLDSQEDWGDLPDIVISDAKESISQIEAGLGISHSKVEEMFKKWL